MSSLESCRRGYKIIDIIYRTNIAYLLENVLGFSRYICDVSDFRQLVCP